MGNAERKEPLIMIGPKGLERVVNSLRTIAPELQFDIKFIELNENQHAIVFDEYRIKAFKVKHNVTCYGYSIEIDRSGKFNAEKAKKLNIPVQNWSILQRGEDVIVDGKKYTPDMVMGSPRKGLKVTYSTDTRPVEAIVEAARDADLFICEGMYGEADKDAKAREYKHMTFKEAAGIAKEANPKEMWLTHYSPSLIKPAQYMDTVTDIFPNSKAGKDGMSVDLAFEE
jgi:ribonuclease Z